MIAFSGGISRGERTLMWPVVPIDVQADDTSTPSRFG